MSDVFVVGVIETLTQPNITSLGTLSSLQVSGVSTFSSVFVSQINSTDIGQNAGLTGQQTNAIAIGNSAGQFSQGTASIAIGFTAGQYSQGQNCIAIGSSAGRTNQGLGSIAIGLNAGSQQATDTIVISAGSSVITGATASATYIQPIRNVTQSNVIGYNTLTKELSYFPSPNSLSRYAILNRSATFSVANSTLAQVTFNDVAINPNSMITFTTNTNTFTFVSTGYYQVSIQVTTADVGSTPRNVEIWFNTTGSATTNRIAWQKTSAVGEISLTSSSIFQITSTTAAYSLYTFQQTGGALTYNSARLNLIRLS